MIVASQDRNARSVLPVPQSDRLIVRGRHDPGVFWVELHRANVVQVAQEGKEAPPCLEIPNLDLVVVASRAKKRLALVEVDSANRTLVLFISV